MSQFDFARKIQSAKNNKVVAQSTRQIQPQVRSFEPAQSDLLTPDEVGLLFQPIIEGRIRVQGIVSHVYAREGMPSVYGNLTYGDGLINFQIPSNQIPEKGTPVIIEGVLSLRASNRTSDHFRYQPHVNGRIVGTFTPQAKGLGVALTRSHTRTAFADNFIGKRAGVPNVLVLSSETARGDIERALSGLYNGELHHMRLAFLTIPFHPDTACAASIEKAYRQYQPDIIVVARGGGDAKEVGVSANSSLVVKALLDTEVPYYSAVGHELNLTLIDKFSDESFHTPTAFGNEVVQVERRIWGLRKRAQELREMKEKIKELEAQREGAVLKLGAARYGSRRARIFFALSLLINIAVAYVLYNAFDKLGPDGFEQLLASFFEQL